MKLMHRAAVLLIAATTLALSGQVMAANAVLATVNGKKITQKDYDMYVQLNAQSAKAPKERIIDELVSRELVYQDAIKKGLDKDKEVKAHLAALKTNVILGAALNKAATRKKITDKELKKLYNDKIANMKMTEYKASHILLKTKEDAEKVITELDMGGDFADLAKKKSTGPSAKQGGDLGWFAPQQMVPEFSGALVQLEKGKYTKVPVKTKFGWHVIKLEDTRDAKPPTFDEVKPRLEQSIQQQRLSDYIKGLRDKAKIKIN
jgi:peptidyl-prolyl cis-trans isomerase C